MVDSFVCLFECDFFLSCVNVCSDDGKKVVTFHMLKIAKVHGVGFIFCSVHIKFIDFFV